MTPIGDTTGGTAGARRMNHSMTGASTSTSTIACPRRAEAAGRSPGAAVGGGETIGALLSQISRSLAELRASVSALLAQIQLRDGSGGGGLAAPARNDAGAGASTLGTRLTAVGGGAGAAPAPMESGGPLPTGSDNRVSAIPQIAAGGSDSLKIATGQVTYRQIPIRASATPRTVTLPGPGQIPGVELEVFALRDWNRGAHSTQVLEAVSGSITIPAGEEVRLLVRARGTAPGSGMVEIDGTRIAMEVAAQRVEALPMMAWVNEPNATKRGASATDVSGVLARFGVSATGTSGAAVSTGAGGSPVQYFSLAFEAANRAPVADAARRVIEAEQRAQAANPGATLWVQVSDEQDTDAGMVAGTVQWISQLRQQLRAMGSNAKLFVAAQARPHNLGYVDVVDGWATTQSAAGRTRDAAMADIGAAAGARGRKVEIMQYPGNAFFDAGTPGSAAVSTASAALDGASSWFLYSANNLDVLEAGGGDEGRGDIGGLVVVDGGRVLPTLALVEAELGANLGAAARSAGGVALGGTGASQVAGFGDALDAYKHPGTAPDLRAWEAEIAAMLR